MKKILLSLLIFILTITLVAPSSFASEKYEDVKKGDPHYDTIMYLIENGLMHTPIVLVVKGKIYYGATHFSPSNTMTKNEVALALVQALSLENESYSNPGYSDVNESDYDFSAIAITTEKGFFKKEKNFNRDKAVTRGEFAAILTKAFEFNGTSKVAFSDVPSKHPYYKHIQALVSNDITAASDKFYPNNALTRAEFATFIARSLEPKFRLKNSKYRNDI